MSHLQEEPKVTIEEPLANTSLNNSSQSSHNMSQPSKSSQLSDTVGFVAVNSIEKLEVIDRVAPIIQETPVVTPKAFPLHPALSAVPNGAPKSKGKYGSISSGTSALLKNRMKQGGIQHFDSGEHFRQMAQDTKNKQAEKKILNNFHSGLSGAPSTDSSSIPESPLASSSNLKPSLIHMAPNAPNKQEYLNHSHLQGSLQGSLRGSSLASSHAPSSLAPISHAPSSLASSSLAPISHAPSSLASSSLASSSLAPSHAPSSLAPSSLAPIREQPLSVSTSTLNPSTLESTTTPILSHRINPLRTPNRRLNNSFVDAQGRTINRLSSASIENFGSDEEDALEEYNKENGIEN
ncbi:hypothetical protein WA158_006110 [Blastocystis sp. Blastoise]